MFPATPRFLSSFESARAGSTAAVDWDTTPDKTILRVGLPPEQVHRRLYFAFVAANTDWEANVEIVGRYQGKDVYALKATLTSHGTLESRSAVAIRPLRRMIFPAWTVRAAVASLGAMPQSEGGANVLRYVFGASDTPDNMGYEVTMWPWNVTGAWDEAVVRLSSYATRFTGPTATAFAEVALAVHSQNTP